MGAITQLPGTIAEGGPAAGPAGLSPDLVLTPIARRPVRLPEATMRAVLESPVPVAPRTAATDPPRASVVIVTFNNVAFTRMCLNSLLANTVGSAYELIVVDNGSTDGTPDFLRGVSAANPHVRLIMDDDNRGFAAANNQGLAAARGDVLVLLNNDTIVPPGWLAGLARRLAEPEVGAVGPVTNRIGNEAEIETDYATYGEFLAFADRTAQEHAGRAFDIPTPCMFCLALRRAAYERVGPLDERFAVGLLEDDDYSLRTRAAGYRLVFAEDVFVHHFGEASFGDLVPTGEYGRLLEANQRRFAAKWGRPWRPYARRPSSAYEASKEIACRVVRTATPTGATVLVVSKGDEEFLDLIRADGRRAWHFPRTGDGTYAGHYPSDCAAAIAHLEELRAGGADYLLIPPSASWWLDRYHQFREWLDRRYPAAHDIGPCEIRHLRPDRTEAPREETANAPSEGK